MLHFSNPKKVLNCLLQGFMIWNVWIMYWIWNQHNVYMEIKENYKARDWILVMGWFGDLDPCMAWDGMRKERGPKLKKRVRASCHLLYWLQRKMKPVGKKAPCLLKKKDVYIGGTRRERQKLKGNKAQSQGRIYTTQRTSMRAHIEEASIFFFFSLI